MLSVTAEETTCEVDWKQQLYNNTAIKKYFFITVLESLVWWKRVRVIYDIRQALHDVKIELAIRRDLLNE